MLQDSFKEHSRWAIAFVVLVIRVVAPECVAFRKKPDKARNLTVLFELESHIGMALTTIWVLTFAKDESRHESGGVFGEYRDLFLMPH